MSIKPRFFISDLHLGGGDQRLEDFDTQCTEQLVNFLDAVSVLGGIKLIINGDFIDFPQIPLGPARSIPSHQFLGTTEAESLQRLEQSIIGHPDEFEALKRFLSKAGNELLIIAGNHDVDFCWPRALRRLRQRIGATEQNFHFGMVYKEAGIYATHGHQYSDDNRLDAPIDFTFNRLYSCWGTRFVEQFFNQVEDQFPLLDNVRPMWKVVLSAILHEELNVTGELAAEFLMFFKQFGIPLKDYAVSALFGWKPKSRAIRPRSIDTFTEQIPFSKLRDRLRARRRADAEFAQTFDATLRALDSTQWDRVMSQEPDISPELADMLQDSESTDNSRGLFEQTDPYQEAAKVIAQHHPDTRAIIMGHTHHGLGMRALKLEQPDSTCLYGNTGTWTKIYTIPRWQLPKLDTLNNPELFVPSSNVIRCTGADETLETAYFDVSEQAVIG